MKKVKIVPVLDIKGGLVVHAVAGRREEYEPYWDSSLVAKPDPYLLVKRLRELNFDTVYIADIDAIETGKVTVNELVRYCKELGFNVLVDIGREGLYRKDEGRISYVIGTEYLELSELACVHDRTMSLDMYGTQVRTRSGYVDVDNVIKYLQYFDTVPARVLVLMLNIVGTESGPPLNEIRNVVKKLRYLGVKEVYYGGGVRNIEDVYNLVMCGIDGVIVGTALHKGRITVAEIEV